ncbi:nucleotidyltransferase domain-containing protein, partial [Candidatus Bathyarchaeota archaeon]|nr:nucleotidyltransferase domain-containing protein [Candidatus Bathyarchaeota archaeon]
MVIEQEIGRRLRDIEQHHSVIILFAVESGSRAWGFQSTDSDYDIRFVYKHNVDWYLSITKKRDVIEDPLDEIFDFSGWDIQKALWLFSKSNPPLLEWLKSPIIYLEQGNFRSDLRDLEEKYFSVKACILHYLHMANGNYREYLKTETVKTKKYFYVLRPLLACEWIRRNKAPPPMEFEKLANEILDDDSVKNRVFDLLSRKRNNEELGEGP